MTPEKLQKMIDRVSEADEAELHAIQGAMNARYRQIRLGNRRQALLTLSVGDRVRLKNVKPKYLVGTEANITARVGAKFRIEFDDGVDPRAITRFGRIVIVDPNSLEKV